MPKLTTRPEITSGLTLDALMHLVIGGTSWKMKLSTLLNFLFGNGQSIKVTYGGQPIAALILPACPGSFVIPSEIVSGQAEYRAIAGPSIARFAYTEGNLSVGYRLTSLSFDDLVGCLGTFNPNAMIAITNLSAPELIHVGVSFLPQNMAALTVLSFPKLKWVNDSFQPGTFASLTSLSFPELVSVGSSFSPQTMAAVTSFSFPKLEFVGGQFSPAAMASLTEMSLPNLKSVMGNFSVQSMAALTTLSFPSMVNYGGTIAANTGNGNISSCVLGTVGTTKLINGATINLSNQKLDASSVNGLLALLVSLDGTNGTTLWGAGKTLNISGGTNAAPSGQGVTDKATLQARGATVTTN